MSFPDDWIQSERGITVYQSAVEAMLRISNWEDIDHYVTNRLVAIPLTWDLTEGLTVDEKGVKRKYLGVRYWSIAAIDAYKKSKKAKLTHEHVLERGRITRFLFDESLKEEKKREILGNYHNFPAVVVTKIEDKALRDDDKKNSHFGWQRYLSAEIVIYDRKERKELDLESKIGSIDPILSSYPKRGKYR